MALTFTFSGAWVLVTVKPVAMVPVMSGVYPVTGSSVMVYAMSRPSLLLFRLVKVCVQFLSAVRVASSTFVSFASRFTLIDVGRLPSWLLLSLQLLVTLTLVFSGV